MTTEITLITKTSHAGLKDAPLTKRISLDSNGSLKSDASGCLLTTGTAERVIAGTAAELAAVIEACAPNQAVALGTLRRNLPDRVAVVTKSKAHTNPDAITRTRANIDYVTGAPGWALIDFDRKGMPEHIADRVQALGGLWEALVWFVPGLMRAARVARSSTSSGLYNAETGAAIPGTGGEHHYVLLKDGGDTERFINDLHQRAWQAGFGWYVVGSSGQLLERSLVDCMVGYGERICFEGSPVVVAPLSQHPRPPIAYDGEAIDSRMVIPALSEYERHRVDEAKAASRAGLMNLAASLRSQHDRMLADQVAAKSGMPTVTAARFVAMRHNGVLLPHLTLEFDELGPVSVSEVLDDPDRFVGETLADPLEGIDYGRCKAMVMRADDGSHFIHSFAHGRAIYHLRYDARTAIAALDKAPAGGIVDFGMAIWAVSHLEEDELQEFTSALAKAAGIKPTAVKARIAKALKERQRSKTALSKGQDGRLVRPRPASDGELTPVVKFVDEVLAADTKEEPPMRDASGNLVVITVSEPWAMHTLSSSGTNSEQEETPGEDALKAPPEPRLSQLTPTQVEMLIEQHIRWIVTKLDESTYDGALGRAYIDAVMQFQDSELPVVRAINTAPLCTSSGAVIDGVGLDRDTNLVHRIDPSLRACIPQGEITDEIAAAAFKLLTDDWLVDVATDLTGKCIAIMMALTLIERPLLGERPAFFVVAGQRGGGKTTVVNMITSAALGRRAAAANWSDRAEERKKSLFSYFRQGVACICWDNIPRGEAISCPHIEAALTSAEVSDRVLGVSRVETVPATTAQFFTGNSILPKGDMASRSLVLPIEVDRPDPENREFRHADPLGWTMANRHKLMSAFYTILLAGARNRPKGQEAKTRFKTWWSLVGWPLEYAASLVGHPLDCAALMRAGEAVDEEAMATSAVLTLFREHWGSSYFTAKDVVKAMDPEPRPGSLSGGPSAADRGKAETLHDALAELCGRRLDRPTAHGIGKLLQKRLVNRPAWFGDGNQVAILKKVTGHAENRYRVELSVAGGGDSARPQKAPPRVGSSAQNPPLSQHSPTDHGPGGNVGNAGNVDVSFRSDVANSTGKPAADGQGWEDEF